MSDTARFRPPLWAWLLTAALLALMLRLGFWQLDRADEKRALLEAYESQADSVAEAMPDPAPAADDLPQRLRVSGEYLDEPQYLMENQVRDGRPGVRVWTPLRRPGGELVLVDRGWIPDPGRDAMVPPMPAASGTREVVGLWRALPRAGVPVHNEACGDEPVLRVVYPRRDALQCRFDGPLADGLLLMQSDGGATPPEMGLRDWRPAHLNPQTHLGYAVQWFGFSVALLVIFVVVNRKKA